MDASREDKRDLAERTKAFALRVIRLCAALPQTHEARILANQLMRSDTSIGANYREARRARSTPEFNAKIGICLMELDESAYWLELLGDSGIIKHEKLAALHYEVNKSIAIFTSSPKKTRKA